VLFYAHDLSSHAYPCLNRGHRIFVYFVSQKNYRTPFRRSLSAGAWAHAPRAHAPYPPLLHHTSVTSVASIDCRLWHSSCDAIQDQWVRSDGAQSTREDLMMVLSQLDYIMIKAEYAEETRESRLQKHVAYLHNFGIISTYLYLLSLHKKRQNKLVLLLLWQKWSTFIHLWRFIRFKSITHVCCIFSCIISHMLQLTSFEFGEFEGHIYRNWLILMLRSRDIWIISFCNEK